MPVNPTSAIAAYTRTLTRGNGPGLEPRETEKGPKFAGLVKAVLEPTRETLARGESASLQGLAGESDLTAVVTAVSNAELTLQTIVAVRDRVIQAYQDILRMPI